MSEIQWTTKKTDVAHWSANDSQTMIVSVANYVDDVLFDWAAYIGGADDHMTSEELKDWVGHYGSKIGRDLAVVVCPGYPPRKYRGS